jgi:hypothetical protein
MMPTSCSFVVATYLLLAMHVTRSNVSVRLGLLCCSWLAQPARNPGPSSFDQQ